MKISKLKALAIATAVVGTASLAAVAGLTAVAVIDKQTSQNQDYPQTGNGDESSLKPSNPSSNNHAEFKKLFIDKKTLQSSEKVFNGLDQIKTINDLWKFYSKPENIPSDLNITLENVAVTSQTPDSTLGLQVKVVINGKTQASFIVYGFSPYTAQDYKTIFEAANPSGKFMKNGQHFKYLDWRVLSLDPKDQNYFPNYFKPVMPRELVANNIVATPESFNLSPGQIVNYHYALNSENKSISVKTSVPVSAYYEYQNPNSDTYKTVSKDWKPVNFDFIKANLPADYTKAEFNKVIWQRWNNSTLADAVNAYRYWYLLDQSNLSSKLKSYVIKSNDQAPAYGKWAIGSIIYGLDGKNLNINPTYDATTNLNGNKSYLNLNWHMHNWKGDSLTQTLANIHKWEAPYNIDGLLNISFDSQKPTALNKDGLVELPVNIKTDVNFNKHAEPQTNYRHSQIVKTTNWTILDALYYYFKNSASLDKSYSTPFFDQFLPALEKLV